METKFEEKVIKPKPKRTCNFINVRNKQDINRIKQIMKSPVDTDFTNTTCLFFISTEDMKDWGLTLKCFPKNEPSQYIWKYSWNWRDGELQAAKHCKSVADDVSGEAATEIESILNNYKK